MAYVLLVILLVGLILYLLPTTSSNAKLAHIGELMFFAALLAFCIVVFAPASARLFH